MLMRNSSQIFDELLVLNAQDGDQRAFELLVSRWADKVHKQIFWITHDHELANDLSQDCWIVVSKTLHKLSDPSKFGSWTLRIAHNKAIDYLRKNKQKLAALDNLKVPEQTSVDEEGENEVLLQKLGAGLARLDEHHKTVLKMHYLTGMPLIQISEVLKVPVGTVKSRLFKARERLKKIIKKNCINHEK